MSKTNTVSPLRQRMIEDIVARKLNRTSPEVTRRPYVGRVDSRAPVFAHRHLTVIKRSTLPLVGRIPHLIQRNARDADRE